MPMIAATTNAMTWELTWARPLLMIHAAIGFGVLAISAHVVWFAWKGDGRSAAWRARRYAGIAWPMYIAALISGALVYPSYMITVRKAWLKRHTTQSGSDFIRGSVGRMQKRVKKVLHQPPYTHSTGGEYPASIPDL